MLFVLYAIFGMIIFMGLLVVTLLAGDENDEMFTDDIPEEPVVTPQHTCVVCGQKFWSWQMRTTNLCTECFKKKVRK